MQATTIYIQQAALVYNVNLEITSEERYTSGVQSKGHPGDCLTIFIDTIISNIFRKPKALD